MICRAHSPEYMKGRLYHMCKQRAIKLFCMKRHNEIHYCSCGVFSLTPQTHNAELITFMGGPSGCLEVCVCVCSARGDTHLGVILDM